MCGTISPLIHRPLWPANGELRYHFYPICTAKKELLIKQLKFL